MTLVEGYFEKKKPLPTPGKSFQLGYHSAAKSYASPLFCTVVKNGHPLLQRSLSLTDVINIMERELSNSSCRKPQKVTLLRPTLPAATMQGPPRHSVNSSALKLDSRSSMYSVITVTDSHLKKGLNNSFRSGISKGHAVSRGLFGLSCAFSPFRWSDATIGAVRACHSWTFPLLALSCHGQECLSSHPNLTPR